MQVTITFHKALRKYTNNVRKYTLEYQENYFELLRACINVFPELERIFKKYLNEKTRSNREELVLIVNNSIVNPADLWFPIEKDADIMLCPLLYGGGGSKIFTVIAVIALVAISIYTGGLAASAAQGVAAGTTGGIATASTAAASSAAIYGAISNIAMGMALNLALSIFTPTAKISNGSLVEGTDDGGARRGNDKFEGLQNSISQQIPVSLCYGLNRVAGQMVSGYINSVSHNKEDIISVGNYV